MFHDDQHGTAVVVTAALHNAARVVGKELGDLRVVVSGAGAAGVAVTAMLQRAGVGDVAVGDSRGIVHAGRADLTDVKQALAASTNSRWPDRFDRRGAAGCRRVRRRVSGSRRGGGRREHGRAVHRLRAGQPRPRGPPRRRRSARRRRGHRAQRLPQPDQQRPGLPRDLPGRPDGGRRHDQRRHEAGRGRGARRRAWPNRRPRRSCRASSTPRWRRRVAAAVAAAARAEGLARR